MYHYTECGLQNIYLKNGYEVHETPYGKGVSIHDADGLDRAIAKNLVFNKPYLTGAEVRFLRVYLDMPQVMLAEILGVGETSVRGWENHRTKITKPAERLLRTLVYEQIHGDGKVRDLIDRITKMNRKSYHKKLEMEEGSGGWEAAAA